MLELVWGLVSQSGVLALIIIVGFDVFEEFGLGVLCGLKAAALKHFLFERSDEGFGPGVVIGIGAGGHALAQARSGQHLAEGSAPTKSSSILATAFAAAISFGA